MTYIQQWEQMRDKVRNLERERQTQLILAPHNAYGFKLNINHPLIRPKWDAFKSAKGLGQYGMTDDLRREFEETVLSSKYMQKCLEQEQQRIGAVEHQFIRMAYAPAQGISAYICWQALSPQTPGADRPSCHTGPVPWRS